MAPDEPAAGRRRALLIATDTYRDPGLSALRAPTGDVAALAAVLGDAAIGGFEVHDLVDRPTEELRREIETFFGEGRPQDLLLLYVSGHGVLSQSRRFYIATATTSLQLLRSTAIEDSFVNDVMQASRARSIVLVLDCCHSGAFGKGLVPKSAMAVDVEHRFEGQGRVTLSASTELEYAFEETDPTGVNELDPAAPGSLFTRSVIDGLQSGEADLDEDGRVSVDDLYDYVCRRVRERSAHQTPGMAGDVRGQIVIARSARRVELPPELERAVGSNLAGIRAGAVSELGALLRAGGAEGAAALAALERLAEDDSRSVAAAALAALGRPPADQAAPEAPPPEPAPRPPRPDGRRRRDAIRAGAAVLALAALVAVLVVVLGGDGGEDTGPSEATPYSFSGTGAQDVVVAPPRAATATVVVASAEPDSQPRPISAQEAGVDVGPGESFGAAIAGGDFNGDGSADLAIGTPDANAVSVVYGTGSGGVDHTVLIHGPPSLNRYGFALLAPDLNDDDYTDLVVGAPGAGADRGAVQILTGRSADLDASGATLLPVPAGIDDNFGFLLRAGDLNGDDVVDLVEGGPDPTGHLTYCLGGGPGALPPSCTALRTPDNDNGTSALAIADLDDDDDDEIIQSDTRTGPDDENGGVLRIWKGSSPRPEGTPTVVGPDRFVGDAEMAEPAAEFGAALDAGPIDSDEYGDIAVGAPGYNAERGAVILIRGGPRLLANRQPPPVDDQQARFGSDVALLDVTSGDPPELVIVAGAAGFDNAVAVRNADGALTPLPGLDSLGLGDDARGLRIGHNSGSDY